MDNIMPKYVAINVNLLLLFNKNLFIYYAQILKE